MKDARKSVRKPRTPAVTKLAAKPAPAKGKTAVRKKAAEVLPRTSQPPPGDDREEKVRAWRPICARSAVASWAVMNWRIGWLPRLR